VKLLLIRQFAYVRNNFIPVKNMTSNSIIKLSCIVNFIDDKKIFSKGENSFECGYVTSFNYIPDIGVLSGQVHASMKNKLYDVKVKCLCNFDKMFLK